jgi:hypothetical protein
VTLHDGYKNLFEANSGNSLLFPFSRFQVMRENIKEVIIMDGTSVKMDHESVMHGLRQEIDAVIQHVNVTKNDNDYPAGKREIALVYTKLQEAKMWAGKVLEEIGSKLPEQYRDEAK